MSSKTLNRILSCLIGLIFFGIVGGTYSVNAMLSKRADKLTNLKAKSQALQREEDDLKIAKREVRKYEPLEKINKAVVPEDKNQAEAVRELVKIAAENSIQLTSITFPPSTLGNGTAKAGATATAAPAPAPTSSSASANPNAGKLSQLTPVKNIPGVYLLQITPTGDPDSPVPYNSLINFLQDLEHNRRTAQVSGITLTPNSYDPTQISFQLVLNEYIKP